MPVELPISEAARRLGLDYQQCRAQLLKGALSGGRDAFGRLYVDESAIRAVLAGRSQASERTPRSRLARRERRSGPVSAEPSDTASPGQTRRFRAQPNTGHRSTSATEQGG